jgi:hypothetical protein
MENTKVKEMTVEIGGIKRTVLEIPPKMKLGTAFAVADEHLSRQPALYQKRWSCTSEIMDVLIEGADEMCTCRGTITGGIRAIPATQLDVVHKD